jgi:prevent-host-death family protein
MISMRFAGVKELKHKTMDLLKESKEEDIIITAHGKPMAILHYISEEDLADHLIENDPAFRKKIEKAYNEFLKGSGISIDEMILKLEKKRGKQRS